MNQPLRILHLEDNQHDRELVRSLLATAGLACEITPAETRAEFQSALKQGMYDLILSDFTIPGYDGLSALALAHEKRPEVPCLFVSGTLGEEQAVESLKLGATDYVLKTRMDRLVPAIQRALREGQERVKCRLAEEELRVREGLLRSVTDRTEDFVFIKDRAGRFVFVNPAICRAYGRTPEEMVGRTAAELNTDAAMAERFMAEDRRVMEERRTLSTEEARTYPDGRPRVFLATKSPRLDAAGNVIGVIGISRDITERKQAEVKLAEERKLLRTLIDNLPAYIFVKDTGGRYLLVNTPHRQQLGLGADSEMLGKTSFDFFPEAIARQFEVDDQTVLRTGQPLTDREEPFEAGGKRGWYLTTKVPLRNAQGHITGLIGIANDITERKQAEAKLRDSEERFRQLAEHINEVFWMSDESRKQMIYISPAYERIWGQTCESLYASPRGWLDAIHAEDRDRVLQSARRNQITGTYDEEYRIVRPDGSIRWIHDRAFPVRDKAGTVYRIAGVAQDITQRFAAEEAAREALAVLDTTADGAFIFDPDTLFFSYVNEGAVRQLGYPREEFLRMTPLDLNTQFDERQFRNLIAPLKTGAQKIFSFSTTQRRKDGTDVPVDVNLQYVSAAGGRPRFVAIARDTTERRKVERQILRTQRLESIGTLAGGVAHDLNNALAPILMATELMRMQYPDATKMIDIVESSARHGADMVRQLVTFAKGVEGERLLIQPQQLFKEMEKIIHGSFPKNIPLRTNYPKQLQMVLGDATQLHQVLLNLCVNARDAMPNGGILTMEAENAEIDATFASPIPEAKPGPYVVWRVTDTGTGIPPEILERIFEPFFSTKSPDKGTGLGLSTVIGIVQSHGGFVRVYSIPGQGTTFAVYLPASDSSTSDTSFVTKAETTFRGNGETILVVDDDAGVRQVTRAVLTALNFKVLTAADGTEALTQVAEKRAELRAVITDLHMPNMDGLSFVRVLKHMLPEAGIIVASGRLEQREETEFTRLGVNAQLNKPFNQEMLVAALKTVFQK